MTVDEAKEHVRSLRSYLEFHQEPPKRDEEAMSVLFAEIERLEACASDNYRDALDKIAKARLEPGHIYEQALMLQKIADKALEG